jgi:hypothetical protein
MELIVNKRGWQRVQKMGLVSLRADRGDRTRQWLNFLKDSRSVFFDSLALIGPGARAMQRRLRKNWTAQRRNLRLLTTRKPESCLEKIISLSAKSRAGPVGEDSGLVIFGLGNIVGFGQDLIDYLEGTSDAIRL